ncbi:phosphoadenosine phosphosulfate reductase family protein [Endozoicomonas sp. G2_2]|uniref:phosphoadenosine phosphosulfate reductase domain-containing protein n=1 Tax=Endozoicomonas sp. G2_2 TaxID=2821092 RepID=UPI001AD9CCF9|nr:phosphoadenosine phosphosulfate reductase family protein [Endozoicomonas sp. G2_2]MBO9471496.1 phosphoadenosine phosphosulfate reductase family protein [Endozoicomonas sp. G2_2]
MASTPAHAIPESLADLVSSGALVVASHSGGADSQSMLISLLQADIPAEQLLVVHASLGAIEWPGAQALAQGQAQSAALPFIVARANKTLFDMVRRRHARRPDVPSWPSPAQRQCTSDLKRGPIAREVRRYATKHGFTTVVNCLGFRADESPARRKRPIWSVNASQTNGRRTWYDHLPIHGWSKSRVFDTIRAAGQSPHPAYAGGNERLSCQFCIMGSYNDLRHAARVHPDLATEYMQLEDETGYTMHASGQSLASIINHKPAQRSLF